MIFFFYKHAHQLMAAYFEVDIDQDVYTEQNERYVIARLHWSSEEKPRSVSGSGSLVSLGKKV